MYCSEYQIILYYRRTKESWQTDNILWIISMHRKGDILPLLQTTQWHSIYHHQFHISCDTLHIKYEQPHWTVTNKIAQCLYVFKGVIMAGLKVIQNYYSFQYVYCIRILLFEPYPFQEHNTSICAFASCTAQLFACWHVRTYHKSPRQLSKQQEP